MSEDNLEPLITQCPNCETRFRVTEAQLQVAQGRVRCGACLGVFDGTAHLSMDGELFERAAGGEDVDRLLEELDVEPIPEAGAAADAGATHRGPAGPDDMPEELLALEAEFLRELRAAQNDDEDDAPVQAPAADADALIVPEHGVGETAPASPAVPSAEPPVPATKPAEETDPATAPELEAEPALETQGAVEAEPPEEQPAFLVPHSRPDAPPQPDADATAPAAAETPEPMAARLNIPAAPPPEFVEEETPRARRSWVTLTLIALALVGLPAQVLWFQYEAWVKDARFRPLYEQICRLADCTLPPMRDVNRIVSKRSVIRVHPERADARIVDVLMVNEADFAQPFPLIELVATTIRGQLVAGRRFKPEEYLQGELASTELMPPRTPVHVSLEIQDPGENALNFEVRFR